MIEIDRRPYAYRTTHKIEEVDVIESGLRRTLLRKDLRRSHLDPHGLGAKPEFLDDPRREIAAYTLLADADLGVPQCIEAGSDWLLLEKVDGVELWQLGELHPWKEAARWLARFHAAFINRPPVGPPFLDYDAAYFAIWPERARAQHSSVARIVEHYDRVVEILMDCPRTFVHGEFYAPNVIIGDHRVAPVDWEMAGVGPAVLDIAALATGWGVAQRDEIVAAYGLIPTECLAAAELHFAMQWLGWSADWQPPPEHRRDWEAEAFGAAELLGL